MPELGTRIKHEAFHRRFTTILSPPPIETLHLLHGEYRYQPQLPPVQKDPVYLIILRGLRDLEKTDIGVAAANVRVWYTTTSPPIWPRTPRTPGSKFYTFKEWYNEFPITVPVSIADGVHTKLSLEDLRVLYQGKHMPLNEWLIDLPDRKMLLSKPNAIKAQQRWWKKTGKSFRFLELPGELRNQVYGHVIDRVYLTTKDVPERCLSGVDNSRVDSIFPGYPSLVIFPGYKCCSHARTGKCNCKYRSERTLTAPVHETADLGLLATNWQFHREVISWIRDCVRKHVFNPTTFSNVLGALQPMVPAFDYKCLSRITLDFTIDQYFEFFGVNEWPCRQELDTALCQNLASLSCLTDLQLRFSSREEECSRGGWNTSRRGCYQVLIDWIITLAFPVLCKIQKVSFVGHVNKDTKGKWERRLRSRMGECPDNFDHQSEARRILDTNDQSGESSCFLQPACICTPKCDGSCE